MLLKEEERLMQAGDYELPNVQDNSDYLEGTLRIQNITKEFTSYDRKEKKVNKAVNELSLSVFKD